MARKSLSSQVIEEVDRVRGILHSLQDSIEPIPGIIIGEALMGLHRIETMCLSAQQRVANEIVLEKTFVVDPDGIPVEDKSKRKTAPLPTRHKRSSAGQGR